MLGFHGNRRWLLVLWLRERVGFDSSPWFHGDAFTHTHTHTHTLWASQSAAPQIIAVDLCIYLFVCLWLGEEQEEERKMRMCQFQLGMSWGREGGREDRVDVAPPAGAGAGGGGAGAGGGAGGSVQAARLLVNLPAVISFLCCPRFRNMWCHFRLH